MVDTAGLLMHAVVHPADIQDRDGGILVMTTLFGLYPFLRKLFADAGYQGPKFRDALAKAIPGMSVEIVKRSDRASGFEVLYRPAERITHRHRLPIPVKGASWPRMGDSLCGLVSVP